MGEPASSSKSPLSTLFTAPSMWAVMLALAALTSSKWAPLETARPKTETAGREQSPPTVNEIGATFARNWEDPLGAAYAGQRSQPAGATSGVDATADIRSTLVLPSSGGDKVGDHFARLHQTHKRLMVMPVMVPGEPYAETRELRMRTQYAVLAALGRCHYDLSLPSRMSYVTLRVQSWLAVVAGEVHTNIVVPVKLYKYSAPKDFVATGAGPQPACEFVLVCWINESQLGDRPLDVMRQILEGLFCEDQRKDITLRIVGPSSSGMLRTMLHEDATTTWDNKTTYQFKGTSTVYSPQATIGSELLPEHEWQFSHCGLTLVRTIGSDRCLVEALRDELRLRDAWPRDKDDRRHIILVFERDTAYGRAIRDTARKLEAEEGRGEELGKIGGYKNLHTYTYLRGIDGMLPGDRADENRGTDTGKPQDKQAAAREHRPEGRSQYDYLRRLKEQIARRQEELYRDNKGEITAIGVVGSDFYDKLLVLRALRPSFPRACFFTTDLDAGYCHPREFEYTRNLIVASHFGLELHRRLQRGVPPFRDSYQTACFFAVLMALHPELLKEVSQKLDTDDPWGLGAATVDEARHLEPLVFEIGRHGPFQLHLPRPDKHCKDSNGGDSAASAGASSSAASNATTFPVSACIHPPGSREKRLIRVWLLILSAASLLACVALYDHHARWAVSYLLSPFTRSWRRSIGRPLSAAVVLLLTAAIISATVCDDNCARGEPFDLTEGISAWPSTLLRFVVFLTCMMFLVWGTNHLKNDMERIGDEFLGSCEITPKPPPVANRRRRRRTTLIRIRMLVLNWLRGSRQSERDSNVASVFAQYASAETPARRCLRVARATAVYLAFAVLLFVATREYPSAPYRGRLAFYSGTFVLILSAVGLGATVFLVLDAAELCRRFVRRLSSATGAWPTAGLDTYREAIQAKADRSTVVSSEGLLTIRAGDEDLKELLTIRVIAQRTKTVAWLIYGPCVFLFLMLLSRHPWLDNWSCPWPLLLIYLLILTAAVIEAVVLRTEAGKARDAVLRRLRDRLLGATATNEARAAQLRLIIERIQGEQEGAFRPLTTDPLLSALAVPVGGISILAILEQVTRSFGS